MSETTVARLPYWEYMRVSESNGDVDLLVLVNDLALRVKKLEEEIAWLRKDNVTGLVTGRGIMD